MLPAHRTREALREIALAEIRQVLAFPASGCSPDDPELKEKLIGAIPLVFPSKAASVRSLLLSGTELIILQVRSAASSLAERLPAPSNALIGVASAWPTFLETARTMLIAAGFAADALLLRDAAIDGWRDGLEQTAGLVCDVFTATRLPKTIRTVTFPVLSEVAIEELKRRARAMASPHL